MLSVPLKDRIQDTLYYKLIKNLWPEVLKVPCNPSNQLGKARKLLRKAKKLAKRVYVDFMSFQQRPHDR